MFAERPLISKIIFLVFLTIFIGLGLYKLTYFGLEYDEVLFINAALGDLDGITFVYLKLFGIPILTYSYIGALKSWIFALVFKIFGVSVLSIRLPVLILATANLVLVYKLVRQNVNHQFALFFFVLLAVDVTFLTLQRFDKGPSAIEMCVKLLILFIATNPKIDWKRKGLTVLTLMLVGTFNKLNFIWFSNAVFGVYFLQNGSVILQFFRKELSFKELISSRLFKSSVAYLMFLILFFVALALIYVKPSSNLSPGFIVSRSIQFLLDLKYTLMHRNVLHVFGWTYQSTVWNYITNIVLFGVVVVNCWLYVSGKIRFKSVHTQVILLVSLLAIQYVLTPDAQKVWHIFVLFPMVSFVMLHTFWLLAEKVEKKQFAFLLIFCVFFVGNVSATSLFYQKINRGECVTEIFIPEVKEVENYLSNQQPTNVLTTDWGIHTQMQALFHDKHRFIEPFRLFRYPKLFAEWWEVEKEILAAEKKFVILQPIGTDIQQLPYYNYNVTFEESWTDEFIIFLEQNGVEVTKETVVKNKCGNQLFAIYKAKFKDSDTSEKSK
ncbi:MAG: hypothetical protein ACI9V1_002595 [Spirosomataceae bacterium]|jgi:hypothetical protein